MKADTKNYPILFVDLKGSELRKIIKSLNAHGLDCTREQAEQIYDFCAPLPDPDEDEDGSELFWRIAPCVRIDWERNKERHDELLKILAAEWEADASPAARERTERRMLIATNGLPDHPEDWDYSCICDECRASA